MAQNPNIPSQIIKSVNFPNFVNSLGIIPTSYKDSMTYYECLAWLCKYLEETVIPTVNQNGEAVEELQNLYIQLKNFVETYTQEELPILVIQKLDEMVEDGTFNRIINQEIFGELNQKINNLTETTNNLTTTTNNLTKQVSELKSKKAIIIGDSWTSTDTGSIDARGGADTWVTAFQYKFGKECINMSEGGAGFYQKGLVNNRDFNDQLLAVYNDESIDNDSIDDIIIYGGINDIDHSVSSQNIIEGCNNFINTANTYFPKAKIHLFYYNNGLPSAYILDQSKIQFINEVKSLFANSSNAIVYNTVTWLSDNPNLFYNNLHPNAEGIKRIANFVLQSINGGYGLDVNISIDKLFLSVNNNELDFGNPSDSSFLVSIFNVSFNPMTGILKRFL